MAEEDVQNAENPEGQQPEEVTEEQVQETRRQKILRELKQRLLCGPGGSVLVHIILVVILLKFAMTGSSGPIQQVEVTVMTADPVTQEKIDEKIEEVKEEVKPEEVTDEVSDTPQDQFSVSDPTLTEPGTGAGGETAGIGSGLGAEVGFEVSMVKSPLILKGLYTTRTGAGRKGALDKYGGGKGNITEGAVLRALRWLKKEQGSDGAWQTPPVAMTSWALLCYLAHGETPASEEFGPTVEKAIKYLVNGQPNWPASYQWPIATYALSEAYGMTKVPMLKDAAYKGLEGVIKGQGDNGGWGYAVPGKSEDRDLSVMGWCVQALKAAKLAGIDHPDLEKTIKQAIVGMKGNADPSGGFGYRGPGKGGLTGVGVLGMQMLGYSKENECRQGLVYLETATFKWDDAWLGAPLYYWYYASQCKFQAGGEVWTGWNKQMAPELVKNQIVLKGAGVDGKDIGYWELPKKGGTVVKDHSTGLVYNTTLCTLMLEVYYRYLPTFKQPEVLKEAAATSSDDIKIE